MNTGRHYKITLYMQKPFPYFKTAFYLHYFICFKRAAVVRNMS